MEKKKYYITTPIYYPSGKWHIGTCYTTVICDAIARFKRMDGFDVFYLTGTDEHGQKMEESAKKANMSTKAFVDERVEDLKKLWKLLNISYDKFIRTTDAEHESAVQKIFTALYEKGYLYKSEYEGWYCTPCESFWTKSQLVDGKCPDCGREVKLMKEESYFFKMSAFSSRLEKLLTENKEFLEPKTRVNEMINNFIKPGLQDLCVTRTSFKWGVEVPFDKKHIVYVWIDALSNYITALGYMGKDDTLFKKYWPADLHMMGKEIIRFHSLIWPAILMALDLPLPKKVYGHGWLLLGSEKVSKSKGNIVDPFFLSDRYGVDAVRYFLLREVPFGQDGVYTNQSLLTRINADLCNDLGNLVSRTTAMINQFFKGVLPKSSKKEETDKELIEIAEGLYEKLKADVDALLIPEALGEIWKLIQRANKYIDETAPWLLFKDESKRERLATVLYNLAESLRIAAIALMPFLTVTPEKILRDLDIDINTVKDFESIKKFGGLTAGAKITKSQGLFPRIDIAKELELMEKRAAEITENKSEKAAPENTDAPKAEITFDDFMKVELKVGKIIASERVPKSEKLLKNTVQIGAETRTIVSGIAKWYTPEQMVGKSVTVVTNLKPVKLCGVLSEGMILCGEDDKGNVVIISPETDLPSGSEVR